MKLKLWLEINMIRQRKFAKELGVSEGALSRWIKGNRRPKPVIAARIEKLTRGKVSRLELLYP